MKIMSNVDYAMRMGKQYYEPETYNHALRVANNVADNLLIPHEKMDYCIELAIMHDLLEDTEYKISDSLTVHFIECLELITKKKNEDYVEYIRRIKEKSDTHPEAYWVKLADMKDHLTQTDTLTDKLKEKYLKALPYLL
jgi:hypothetical protein